ncbi:cell division protein FtsQ/DivIB [Xylophilus sp. GW821-FHT01B05]
MADTLPQPFDVRLMNVTAAVLFLGGVALVLMAAGWWGLRHPAFALGRIEVEGDLAHNNAITLRANVAHRLQGNFFTMDLGATRAAFESVPWVRRATVQREFPNRLHVTLEEHKAVAFWGPESGSTLLNDHGEVFEANVDDIDDDELPRLLGPDGQARDVWAMEQWLAPVFEPLGVRLVELELSGRGSWRATLEDGATVELGGGTPPDILTRTKRFVRTLPEVAAKYGRRADALESADLRHTDGYALRLRGVTTVTAEAAARIAAKPPARPAPRPTR